MLDGGEDREEVTLAFSFAVGNVAPISIGFSSYLLKFTLKNIWRLNTNVCITCRPLPMAVRDKHSTAI